MRTDFLRDIQVVLFDVSGTLLEFRGGGLTNEEKDNIGLQRLSDFLEDFLATSAPPSMLRKLFLEPWYAALPGRKADNCEVNADSYLLSALHLDAKVVSQADIVKAFSAFMSEYSHRATVAPHMLELLRFLQSWGKRVGVVANCPVYGAVYRDILTRHGLADYISAWAFSYDHGYRKPDARLFQDVMAPLGAVPAACAIVGDSLEEDIQGARNAGIKAVWFNPRGQSSGGVPVDYDLRDMGELIWQ
jgi:HAD superfamily hydrolase (TIGR01549 family)